MRDEYLPFSRPSITDADVQAVTDVLRSGWITTGARCRAFEDAVAGRTGAAGAVAATSGTAIMHLLLHALDIGPGDEVITPSMTWVSTVNLIVLRGATPVFVDVDRDTLLIDPAAVERACSDRTRLIVPVHFAGAPADMDAIDRIAAARGVRVIEDAAHALGTSYRERVVGARGTAVFSFHPIKNVTAGEAGMLVSDDLALLDRVRRLRFHGLGQDAHERRTQGRAPQAEVLEPGFKYNLPDLCAALGASQVARLDAMNERRRHLADRYRAALRGVPMLQPLGDPAYPIGHAWHLYVVRLLTEEAGLTRADFMAGMEARQIGTGIHFRAVHEQRWYADRPELRHEPLPATEWNSARIMSLPLFPDMTDGDVDDVVRAAADVLAAAPLERTAT